ncbi:MAG: CHRD domain-containing protein [Alphaproteobacteria bacterium]|nr:CHRD domain-containing protein [Alphaproteobacteria bacterium]
MHRYGLTAIAATAAIAFSASYACAQEFAAHLTGFSEIGEITGPYTGAILSDATGAAKLYLDRNAGTITYTLTYSNVGTTPPLTGTVTQAHIHFGKSRNSGGILVFFCSNLGNGPAGTPTCPLNSGTVTGTWTKASVVAIPGQNVNAGDFDALTDALISNTAYANVHQTGLPAGEIRGQIYGAEQEEQQRR